MARRKRRSLGELKHSRKKVARAFKRDGNSYNTKGIKKFGIDVTVFRKGDGGFGAGACVRKRIGMPRAKCGWGYGSTPTAATRAALRHLARDIPR